MAIAHAISAKDYGRAAALDQARRDILQDVCLMDIKSIDVNFFNMIEDCARQNASLISQWKRICNKSVGKPVVH